VLRKELERQIIERANRDPSFRQRLLADPKAAIEEHLGIRLPPTFQVIVVEEAPNQAYLVLPAPRPSPGKPDDLQCDPDLLPPTWDC
jgi:hypothetical protein